MFPDAALPDVGTLVLNLFYVVAITAILVALLPLYRRLRASRADREALHRRLTEMDGAITRLRDDQEVMGKAQVNQQDDIKRLIVITQRQDRTLLEQSNALERIERTLTDLATRDTARDTARQVVQDLLARFPGVTVNSRTGGADFGHHTRVRGAVVGGDVDSKGDDE